MNKFRLAMAVEVLYWAMLWLIAFVLVAWLSGICQAQAVNVVNPSKDGPHQQTIYRVLDYNAK